MSQSSRSSGLRVLVLSLVLGSARGEAGQVPSQGETKLPLQTAVVLTPGFCNTKVKKGGWSKKENFEVGKAVCSELPAALQSVFARVTSVDAPSSLGDAQLVLTPKFIDVTATQPKMAFSNRDLVLLVEWTAKDNSGKTVWIETVQGSARHHGGNAFTYKKNLKLIVTDASKNLAEQSANKMYAATPLRELADIASTKN